MLIHLDDKCVVFTKMHYYYYRLFFTYIVITYMYIHVQYYYDTILVVMLANVVEC
mgnify:CR=1 FL=1